MSTGGFVCRRDGEYHLVRMLGRNRARLNNVILKHLNGRKLTWAEREVCAFRQTTSPVQPPPSIIMTTDRVFWGGSLPLSVLSKNRILDRMTLSQPAWLANTIWDEIGFATIGGRRTAILVNAISHPIDLEGQTLLADHLSDFAAFVNALEEARKWLRATVNSDRWTTTVHYGHVRALAALWHLQKIGVDAVYVPIYMLGDRHMMPRSVGRTTEKPCPMSREEWTQPLRAMYDSLGIVHIGKELFGIHELFLDVEKVQAC